MELTVSYYKVCGLCKLIHFEYVVNQNDVRVATSQRLPEESKEPRPSRRGILAGFRKLSPSTPKPRRISGSAIGA